MSREFYNILAGITDVPVVNIQQFRRIGESKFYSVIFASVNSKEYTTADYDAAIAAMTDNKLRIEDSTLFPIESNAQQPLFRCILASQTNSIPYSEEALKEHGLTLVQANTFADENDQVWSLVGTGNSQRLVQITEDDHDGILEVKRARNPIVASFDSTVPVSEGDYVYFFNTQSSAMDHGFAVMLNGQGRIFSKSTEKLVDVEAHAVMQAADCSDIAGSPLHHKLALLASSAFDKSAFIKYMRDLYGGSDMIKALEKAIRATGVK